VYDPASGQLLAGSFMDYAMPRADDLPDITSALRPAPARTHKLGVKGVGEAGTTAALAAIMNAVADALPEAPNIDMPATPERVWRALGGRSKAVTRGGNHGELWTDRHRVLDAGRDTRIRYFYLPCRQANSDHSGME